MKMKRDKIWGKAENIFLAFEKSRENEGGQNVVEKLRLLRFPIKIQNL